MKGFANRLEATAEYYFSSKLREVNQLIAAGKPIINLGIGSPDLPPDPIVIKALQNTAEHAQAHGYQTYQGIPALREAMAAYYLREFNVNLQAHQEILPLMGSKEGILLLGLAFLNPGDTVLIPDPGYPTYAAVAKILQCNTICYPLQQDGGPDWRFLENQDLSSVKLFWVNYPHMPTGFRGSKELFEKLIAFAREKNLILINDNPYSHILNPNPLSILSIEGAKEVALELNSLSKTFNIPGWRVGMLCGKEAWIQAVLRVKSNMDSGMFLGIQHGAIAALQLGKTWFENLYENYSNRRKLAWKFAESLGLQVEKDRAGLFVWARVPASQDPEKLVDELLYEKNIFITPGKVFGENGKEFVRISLCMPEFKLLEAINRIKIPSNQPK